MSYNEKYTYVKEQITTALIMLMKTNKFEDISITTIITTGGVSRASFYRNFTSKEDVINQYLVRLIMEWLHSDPILIHQDFIGQLFKHFEDHRDTYFLLYNANLSHLLLNIIVGFLGPGKGMEPIDEYSKSFLAYGLFGWINQWFSNGMRESAEEIATLYKKADTNQRDN